MFNGSDISDSYPNENETTRARRRLCCCFASRQETIDDENREQIIEVTRVSQTQQAIDVTEMLQQMMSVPQLSESQPAAFTSVPSSEECDGKVLVENKCNYEEEKKLMIESDSGSNERICRYCFEGDGDMITPCKCIGSQKWVHKECLRKWQRMCQVRKSTHPWYRDGSKSEEFCYVCSSRFSLAPPSYNELVAGLSGEQIVSRVREGFMIVATIQSSEQSRAILLVNGHIEQIRNTLTPWIGGVYLIIRIYPGSSDVMITAVNLTKEFRRPPHHLVSYVRRIVGSKKVKVKYMDCGPCEGLQGVGCLHATSSEYVERETNLRVMDDMPYGVTVAGALEGVIRISHEDWERENSNEVHKRRKLSLMPAPPPRLVYVCYGDGTWTRSQLMGEIARGSWGMAVYKSSDVFKVPNEPDPPSPSEIYMKLHNENRPIAPRANEMSRDFDEASVPRPFEDTEEARRHREQLRAQLLANCKRRTVLSGQTALEHEESEDLEILSGGTVRTEDVKAESSLRTETEDQSDLVREV